MKRRMKEREFQYMAINKFTQCTNVLLDNEVILWLAFYLSEYILQIVRYTDARTATKFAWLQDPYVSHSVQLVLRINLFQFRQYRIRQLQILLNNVIECRRWARLR